MKCRVCDWEGTAEKLPAREMMYGTREEFTYFVCPNCHCLQIENIPSDLGKYYDRDYYSYDTPDIVHADTENRDETRILDVGCGAGKWLCEMAQRGYVNLTGCDPFIEQDKQYENGVKIYKKTIHEMDGEFDRIQLNDSFEHMTDPHEVLDSIYRLLSADGTAIIRIPIFPNGAYEIFGMHWFQIDAPRHIVLYSIEGMQLLTKQHNLKIKHIQFDSSNAQFIRSFLYGKDIPLKEQTMETILQYFKPEDIDTFSEYAKGLNAREYGDHATISIGFL